MVFAVSPLAYPGFEQHRLPLLANGQLKTTRRRGERCYSDNTRWR